MKVHSDTTAEQKEQGYSTRQHPLPLRKTAETLPPVEIPVRNMLT